MIKKNKSQFALEFIVLIAFMFLVFVGFFAIVSARILEAKESENKQIAETLANLVFDEIKLANSAEDGYSRTFNIPTRVKGSTYTISIASNRELTVNYLGNEHVIFLPSNTQGDVVLGLNSISKPNGTVFLSAVS